MKCSHCGREEAEYAVPSTDGVIFLTGARCSIYVHRAFPENFMKAKVILPGRKVVSR